MTPPVTRAIWPSRDSPDPGRRRNSAEKTVAEGKRPDPKRRAPASRPGASGRGRSRPKSVGTGGKRSTGLRAQAESVGHGLTDPIRRVIAASIEQQSEQRLGFTARRAAILAAMVCVLTLTIAGPVRTYFAQRTEMNQLAASESALREQIAAVRDELDRSKEENEAYRQQIAGLRTKLEAARSTPRTATREPGLATAGISSTRKIKCGLASNASTAVRTPNSKPPSRAPVS